MPFVALPHIALDDVWGAGIDGEVYRVDTAYEFLVQRIQAFARGTWTLALVAGDSVWASAEPGDALVGIDTATNTAGPSFAVSFIVGEAPAPVWIAADGEHLVVDADREARRDRSGREEDRALVPDGSRSARCSAWRRGGPNTPSDNNFWFFLSTAIGRDTPREAPTPHGFSVKVDFDRATLAPPVMNVPSVEGAAQSDGMLWIAPTWQARLIYFPTS